MPARVARVRVLIGFSTALPQSLIQMSFRRRVRTGARMPAAISAFEIACTRSERLPSGSPRTKRLSEM